MVEYYKTNKGYYFKIKKNKKIRISKEEFLKKNKQKGGSNNSEEAQIKQIAESLKSLKHECTAPNHMGWVIMLHGNIIPPDLSKHDQYLPQLPLNVALYLYTPIFSLLKSNISQTKKLLTGLCKVACNPNTNGSQMREIIDKGYNISKVEPGSFYYDMNLGGSRGFVPKETYGLFRCDKNNNFYPIQILENPEDFTTLGYIVNEITKSNPTYNHSIHIFSCRGKSKPESHIWDTYKNKLPINSFKLPFYGELPNQYMPTGLKRGW